MSKNNEDLLNYIQEGYQNQKRPIQVGKGVVSALETIILPYVKKIQITLGRKGIKLNHNYSKNFEVEVM